MKIFNCFRNLGDHVSAEILAEIRQADDLMEKLASRTELENDVVVLSGLGEIDQFSDVGVIKVAHNLNFLEDVGSLWGNNQ
jgi:hypothetical protein